MALSETEFARKAKDLTLTYGEVIEFAANQPKRKGVDPAKIKTLGNPKAVKAVGIPLDTPFYRLSETDFMSRFRKLHGGANRWYNFQNLETAISPTMDKFGLATVIRNYEEFEVQAYPKISGTGNLADRTGLGGTQRDGLAGTREMKGLIPVSELDSIYADSFEKDKISQLERDALTYHRNTFQRPGQIFSSDTGGIKKSDVSVAGDFVIIAEKDDADSNKKRNKIKYNKNSEMGQLILRNLNASKSEFLFDISNQQYSNLFNRTIMPKILVLHEDKLPFIDGLNESKGRVSGPSIIRSAMSRIFQDEFAAPDDVVEALMGHKKSSILSKNYTGFVPDLGLGDIIERYSFGTTESSFTMQGVADARVRAAGISNLSNEQLEDLGYSSVEERTALAEKRAAGFKLEALNLDIERVTKLQSPEGQKYLAALEALEEADHKKKLEGIKREAEIKAAQADAAKDARQLNQIEQDKNDLLNLDYDEDDVSRRKALAKLVGKGLKAGGAAVAPLVPPVGAGLIVGGAVLDTMTGAPLAAESGKKFGEAATTDDPEEKRRLQMEGLGLGAKSLVAAFSPVTFEERTPEQEKYLRESRERRETRMKERVDRVREGLNNRREGNTSTQMDELMSK